MKIVISPDPILREVCSPIDQIDGSIKRLAKQMAKDMYKNDGCGIAAPQVGVTKRMVVIDCTDQEKKEPITLINPEIVEHSDETWVADEGCLSLPGINCPIERYTSVKVAYTDLEGNSCEIEGGQDLLGRCLQHELDHLDGVTMFERLNPLDRIKALQVYQNALDHGAKPDSARVSISQE